MRIAKVFHYLCKPIESTKNEKTDTDNSVGGQPGGGGLCLIVLGSRPALEGAATQCFPELDAVFRAADGGAGRHAVVSGCMAEPAFLLPVVGRRGAVWRMAVADVADGARVPHS